MSNSSPSKQRCIEFIKRYTQEHGDTPGAVAIFEAGRASVETADGYGHHCKDHPGAIFLPSHGCPTCAVFAAPYSLSEKTPGDLTEAEQLLQAWADLLPPNGNLYFEHTKRAREYFARRAEKTNAALDDMVRASEAVDGYELGSVSQAQSMGNFIRQCVEQRQADETQCEHGVPRRFCTAAHDEKTAEELPPYSPEIHHALVIASLRPEDVSHATYHGACSVLAADVQRLRGIHKKAEDALRAVNGEGSHA